MSDIPRRTAARTAKLASLPLGCRRPRRRRLGPPARRRQRRRDLRAADGQERRAAVRRARRAQGRRDEVRPGAVGVRGRGPRRVAGAVPRVADRSCRPPRRRCRAATCTDMLAEQFGRGLARAVPRVRRHPGGGGEHRPGAPGGVARRARRRGQGAVPGGRGGAALGPAAAGADEPAAAAARAGHWRSSRSSPSCATGWRRSSTTATRRPTSARSPRRSTGDPPIAVPRVVASAPRAMVSEWVTGRKLSDVIRAGTPGRAGRRGGAARRVPLLGARHGSGCCTPTRTPATSSCSPTAACWCSTTARWPGCPKACPGRCR